MTIYSLFCKYPDKSWWSDKAKAQRRAAEYGLSAYRCHDHYHIGHKTKRDAADVEDTDDVATGHPS